jgi:nucleoside 2-deoxyribosyltransferase
MQLYLAGPLGFSEAGNFFKDKLLKPELERLGFKVVDPWELTDAKMINSILQLPYGLERRQAWEKLNPEIGRRNHEAIDRVDIVVAVLDGADVDSGTAAEIGYAFAKQKTIIGYRGDFRLSADNEGSVVNLQVEYFVRASGGQIVSRMSELLLALGQLKK